jgi:hypothetical protein
MDSKKKNALKPEGEQASLAHGSAWQVICDGVVGKVPLFAYLRLSSKRSFPLINIMALPSCYDMFS